MKDLLYIIEGHTKFMQHYDTVNNSIAYNFGPNHNNEVV